jgi:hypothetical protein
VSVNVKLSLQVACPSGSDAAADVVAALRQLFVQKGIDDDVVLAEDHGTVNGRTPYPLIISRFYQWRGTFEDAIRSTVTGVAPDAAVTIDWDYPDGP